MSFDEEGSGQLVSGAFMDYCLPRADDLPSFSIDFRCTPNPSNVLGIKDCRESGTCGRHLLSTTRWSMRHGIRGSGISTTRIDRFVFGRRCGWLVEANTPVPLTMTPASAPPAPCTDCAAQSSCYVSASRRHTIGKLGWSKGSPTARRGGGKSGNTGPGRST